MDLGGSSVAGPRPYNEDNYLLSDLSQHRKRLAGLTAFIMVSDGMGGHSSGDVASKLAVETATSYLKDLIELAEHSDLEIDVPQALMEISAEAHDAIVAAAGEAGGGSMGATFVAAFVARDRAWVGHVGDSRAYVISGGRARQLTIDHSQVGRLISEGVLTEEQAQHHPSRNVIDRALGFKGASAEITELALRSGDAIVLCSDGVSTALSGDDMAAIMTGQPDAMHAASALVNDAIVAGGDDNATAVLWTDDWMAFQKVSGAAGRARHGRARGRKQTSRHFRAQRASFVVIGIMVALALGFIGSTMLSTPPRGSGAPPAAVQSADTSPTESPTGTPNASASAETTIKVVPENPDYYLRSEQNQADSSRVARLLPGTKLVVLTSSLPDKKLFFEVPLSSVIADWLVNPRLLKAVQKAQHLYVYKWRRP